VPDRTPGGTVNDAAKLESVGAWRAVISSQENWRLRPCPHLFRSPALRRGGEANLSQPTQCFCPRRLVFLRRPPIVDSAKQRIVKPHHDLLARTSRSWSPNFF
jgi:hypothetical protein